MASIEEVRAGILATKDKADEALGAVNKAHAHMEEVQAGAARAMEGSGQVDVTNALGLAAQTVNDLEQTRAQISAFISEAESISNRL